MDCGPFFFRPGPIRMNLHDGAIDRQRFHVDADDLFLLQRREDPIQDAGLGPPVHPSVDRMPAAKTLGERPPLASVLGDVQDRIQHVQVRDRDIPTLRGKAPFDASELLFGDHHTLEDNHRKLV